MIPLAEVFATAMQHHKAGQLQQAERLYRQILETDPRHVEALHLLGVIACQDGRGEIGVDYIRAALRLAPDFAQAYSNLGFFLQQQGKLEEAAASLRQAVRLRPGLAEAHNNLGSVLIDLEQAEEAVAALWQAIRLKPDFAEAHNNLGNAYKLQGKVDEAIAGYQEALRLKPDFAVVYNNLANLLFQTEKLEEAVGYYRKGLRLKPGDAEVHINLGYALLDQGKLAEAEASFREAQRLKPGHAPGHYHMGNAFIHQGKLVEAMACYQEALRLQPDYADAHNNLGNALNLLGRPHEAAAAFKEAIRLRPDFADAHLNLALAYLQTGDFEQGWTEYEWRWLMKGVGRPPLLSSKPVWDGTPLAGKTILLHAEQGLGDTLQFIRYAVQVKERGGRVLVVCPESLIRLLGRCAGIDRLIPGGVPVGPFDVHAPLLSLPRLLGMKSVQHIPAHVPYLDAEPDLVRSWGARLESLRGFRVGIVWQGNPRPWNFQLRCADKRRSIPLAQFEPLARVPGVTLVSLQKGFGAEQLTQVADRFPVIDVGGMLNDFADTAAVMKNLDLVISADTSPAHLAGALGVPVWVLVPRQSCWRWLLDRDDSPWYPTMRLFRQKRVESWDEVFERMTRALEKR